MLKCRVFNIIGLFVLPLNFPYNNKVVGESKVKGYPIYQSNNRQLNDGNDRSKKCEIHTWHCLKLVKMKKRKVK